jgi:hypothetical protein
MIIAFMKAFLTTICVVATAIGVWADLLSWYCVIRLVQDPGFRTSALPFVGFLFYLFAACTERLPLWLFAALCSAHFSMVVSLFAVRWRITRKQKNEKSGDKEG